MSFPAPEFPDTFAARLATAFNRRLRIRWSPQFGEWAIEQQVRRGFVEGLRPKKAGWDESVDDYIRYRDGYVHVVSVRTGDRMPCPKCRTDLKVPFMLTEVIRCAFCRLKGADSFVPAMFVPLNDSLITYLKRIDPEHEASESLSQDLENRNDSLAASMERDAAGRMSSGWDDYYARIHGIQQVGYTGKVFAG